MGASTMPADPGAPPGPFSDAELGRRRAALLDAAAEAGVDALLLYGANRTGSAVPWVTDWPVTRAAAVLLDAGADPLLLVGFHNHVPEARRLARDCEVGWLGPDPAERLLEALRGRGHRRVGLVGPVPYQLHGRLAAGLDRLQGLDDGYTRLRLTKSSEEVARLRYAAWLTDRSAAALAAAAEPGTSEHELVAAVEAAYLPYGGSNHIHYLAATPMAEPDRCVPAQWPRERRLRAGDVLTFELSTSYGADYPGQLLRTVTVAAGATELFARLHAVAEEALGRVLAALRDGVTPAQLVAAAEVIEGAGFTTVDDLVHGFGGGYLPPVVGSRSRTLWPVPEEPLRTGMTVVVQPNVCTPDLRAGVQTGELVLVTADGYERLHAFPPGLHRGGTDPRRTP